MAADECQFLWPAGNSMHIAYSMEDYILIKTGNNNIQFSLGVWSGSQWHYALDTTWIDCIGGRKYYIKIQDIINPWPTNVTNLNFNVWGHNGSESSTGVSITIYKSGLGLPTVPSTEDKIEQTSVSRYVTILTTAYEWYNVNTQSIPSLAAGTQIKAAEINSLTPYNSVTLNNIDYNLRVNQNESPSPSIIANLNTYFNTFIHRKKVFFNNDNAPGPSTIFTQSTGVSPNISKLFLVNSGY